MDYDENLRRLLVTSFREQGFRVLTAAGDREALARLHSDKPSCLLLDLGIADLGGLDLLRSIHRDPPSGDLIVVVLSESAELEQKLACLSAGAHEYLVRPVDAREVVARVQRFLRMIDEIRHAAPPPAQAEKRYLVPMATLDKDESHGTVDLISPSADSFARIKPNYGIYRVENLIGSGGMGYVFKAYEEPLDRFVAVKILSRKLSSSPEFVQRFRHEAKVLASLNHPGIAFIYSFGEEEGEHYFAMQWCPGGSLEDLVRKKGRLELLPAVDILLQCAHALHAASRKGIVHRDIKPTNLLFDENQQIKIVDFGLASGDKNSVRITQAREFIGTPSFMAPEQAQSSTVDHRADIYALGITFYYMLYGRHPYEANSAIEMLIKHASEPFPAYESLDGRVPKSAYDVMTAMTQKNPDDRYRDYTALIEQLEKLRKDLLIQSQWKIPRVEQITVDPTSRNTNLFELLSIIYSQSVSGVLTAQWSTLRKKFLIRQRELILFDSPQPDESIWNELVRRKLLEPNNVPPRDEDLEKSLNRYLLQQSFAFEDFKNSYRQLMKAALMQVFFWPKMEAEFQNATIEHDAFTSIRLGDLLLESARTLLPAEMVMARISDATAFHRTSQFELVLSSLDLRPEESFAAYRIEGKETTVTTLQLLTGMPEEKLARFIYAIESMGAVQLRSLEERRPVKKFDSHATPVPQAIPSIPQTPVRETTPPPRPVKPASEETPVPKADEAAARMDVQKPERKMEAEHHVKVADQFFRLAQDKFAELDYWKATELCKQAIKHNPSDSRYYHLMARAYSHHPRFAKDAEQCFYKAIEVDPWNPDFHMDLARFYLQQGFPTRALSQCEKALKIAPQNPAAKDLMAELTTRK